jgi:hypothetical protein
MCCHINCLLTVRFYHYHQLYSDKNIHVDVHEVHNFSNAYGSKVTNLSQG